MIPHSRIFWDRARCLAGGGSLRGFGAPSWTQKLKCFSTSGPQSLMCYGLPCSYKEEDWETVEQFLKREQLLGPVPRNRLIDVKPNQPYMATEPGKRFMWSAAMIPFMSHSNGVSSSGVFTSGELRVFKPLGVLAVKEFIFKDQPLTDDLLRSDYSEAKSYLVSLLEQEKGPGVLKDVPRNLKRWLDMMDSQQIDDDDIAFNPCLLPRESIGVLGVDIYTNVRKALPNFGGKTGREQARDILAAIPDETLKEKWPVNVDKNPFLHHWRTFKPGMQQNETVAGRKGKGTGTGEEKCRGSTRKGEGMTGTGKKGRKKNKDKVEVKAMTKEEEVTKKGKGAGKNSEMKGTAEAMAKEREEADQLRKAIKLGCAVVDIHRHSYMHAYERIIMKMLQTLNKKQHLSFFRGEPYSIWDVSDLLQYEFPEYLQQALEAIKKHSPQLWKDLNIRGRFPLPISLPPGKSSRNVPQNRSREPNIKVPQNRSREPNIKVPQNRSREPNIKVPQNRSREPNIKVSQNRSRRGY